MLSPVGIVFANLLCILCWIHRNGKGDHFSLTTNSETNIAFLTSDEWNSSKNCAWHFLWACIPMHLCFLTDAVLLTKASSTFRLLLLKNCCFFLRFYEQITWWRRERNTNKYWCCRWQCCCFVHFSHRKHSRKKRKFTYKMHIWQMFNLKWEFVRSSK